jgi:hypothetical protein
MTAKPFRLSITTLSGTLAYTRGMPIDEEGTIRQLVFAAANPRAPVSLPDSIGTVDTRAQGRIDAHLREWAWALPITSFVPSVATSLEDLPDMTSVLLDTPLEDISFDDFDFGEPTLDVPLASETDLSDTFGVVSMRQFRRADRLHYKPLLLSTVTVNAKGTWTLTNVALHVIHAIEYFGNINPMSDVAMRNALLDDLVFRELPAYLGHHSIRTTLQLSPAMADLLPTLHSHPVSPPLRYTCDIQSSNLKCVSRHDVDLTVKPMLRHYFGLSFDTDTQPTPGDVMVAITDLLKDVLVTKSENGSTVSLTDAAGDPGTAEYTQLLGKILLANSTRQAVTLQELQRTKMAKHARVHSLAIGQQVLAVAVLCDSPQHGPVVLSIGLHSAVTSAMVESNATPATLQTCKALLGLLLEHIDRAEQSSYKFASTSKRGSQGIFYRVVCGLPARPGDTLIASVPKYSVSVEPKKDNIGATQVINFSRGKNKTSFSTNAAKKAKRV